MEEEWRDIKDYEGLYQVSNLGRVKSLNYSNTRKERILKSSLIKGYKTVSLGRLKKQYIHRLVAETFIPNPNKLPMINHKDENKQNNCMDNLEWCTNQYNMCYSYGIKIKCLDLETNQETIYPSIHEAARQLKIYSSVIRYSLYKTKVPYKNRYIFSEIKNEED